MSVEELVKRLRSRACEIYGQTRYSNYLDEAADKLEELAAEVYSDTKEAYTVVRKKFYHSEWGMSKLLEARNGGLVTDKGEAWFYEHTSKDGVGGSYDMLFRRVYTHPIPSEPTPERNRKLSDQPYIHIFRSLN